MSRKFQEVRDRTPRHKGRCTVCQKPYEPGEPRGRLQITLNSLEYVKNTGDARTRKKGDKTPVWKQNISAIAAKTRTACESCSVDLYEEIENLILNKMGGTGRLDDHEPPA